MNQEIFTLGLAVETVSLYLLCAATADPDDTVRRHRVAAVWNGGGEALEKALAELEQRGILAAGDRSGAAPDTYRITAADRWRAPG